MRTLVVSKLTVDPLRLAIRNYTYWLQFQEMRSDAADTSPSMRAINTIKP